MKKLICQVLFFTGIISFSQPPDLKFTDPAIISIDGESFVVVSEFKKVESASAPAQFQIKGGTLSISVRGIIDRSVSSPVIISLFVREFTDNKLIIFANQDSQKIQYNIEGAGSGLYSGQYNPNGFFMVKTRFKITAPGYPSYFLEIPLNVHVSFSGAISYDRSFADGIAYVYNAGKKRRLRKILTKNSF